jgi:cell shape-determining protein MreC
MLIKRQNPSHKKLKIRIALCAFFIAILFIIPATRKIIRHTFTYVSMPFVYTVNAIENKFSNIYQTLRYKSSLVTENKNLSNQILNLNAHYSNYDELILENKELKQSMGRASSTNYILAVVLSKPPSSPYDSVIIDGGERAGMQIGQTVYVNGNVPIGTINDVFLHTALVQLYSSPSQKMDARLDPAHIDVTLFGRGGGNFLVSVPHDLTVEQNSVIVSKEINPHVLGKLEKIISDPRDSSQTLIFSSPININQLSFVQVEK